jgi:hypothetical protein
MPRGASPEQLKSARVRAKHIPAEAEAERKLLFDRLIADLGRPATALEECALEQISAKMIRSRRLRAQGRDDREETRAIAQLMRASGFKPQPISAKPAAPSIDDLLSEIAAKPIDGVAP